MKKILNSLIIISFFFLATYASAHVTLDPKQTVVGRQSYYVRVPNEKDVATTQVKIIVPDGVEVTGILPVYGWDHKEVTEKADSMVETDEHGHEEESQGRITEITWTGGKINPGEYMLFGFSTNYTGKAESLVWKAYQTYADGEVVSWDDTNEKNPAPKVAIMKNVPPNTQTEKEIKTVETNSSMSMSLAGAALALSVISLVISLKSRKIKI